MLELLEQIAAKVGVKVKTDTEREAMQDTTQPEKVLEQIDRSVEASDNRRESRKRNP